MNIEEIKIERNTIPYVDLVNIVDFAVKNSFGKASGKYHKYMQDYAETLALLVAYTNYTIEEMKEDDLFEEVLQIRHSDHWKNEIVPEIEQYNAFVEYVDEEIETLTRPLANFDSTLNSVKEAADAFVNVLNVIDKEKLQSVDFTGLVEALAALEGSKTGATIEEVNNNIVEFNEKHKD